MPDRETDVADVAADVADGIRDAILLIDKY